MNRNLLVGLIVVLLAIGGFVLVQNSSTTEAPTDNLNQAQNRTDESTVTQQENSGEADNEAEGNEHTVTLTQNGFEPQTITVKAGEKVVWVNNSGSTATVDSNNHPTHRIFPGLNLGGFSDGEKHEMVFDKPGTYGYHDHLNASRTGKVVVE